MSIFLQSVKAIQKTEYRIKDLGRVVTGKTPSKDNPTDWGTDIDFITPTDFAADSKYLEGVGRKISMDGMNRYKNMILQAGAVVVTCIGSDMGKVVVSRKKALTNQQINSIIVNRSVFDVDFVYYKLKSLYPELRSIAEEGGSTMPIITKTTFENIQLNAPELSVQKEIAHVLNIYDEKIENNNRIIKNLEDMAQTVFDEWFVKFRFPGYEKVKMIDSDMGQIPEGWSACKIGDVIELAYGKALKEEDRIAGGFPVVGSSGVVGRHAEKIVSGPGIVIGRKGNAGSVIWVDEGFYPIDTTFYVKTGLAMIYCFFLLNKQIFSSSDSAVPGLNRDVAYMNDILIADDQTISLFCNKVTAIFQIRRSLEDENSLLEKSRDVLLKQLI